MTEKVYVYEYGSDPRPAKVLSRYPATVTGRAGPYQQEFIQVEFTDERGGNRNCFASSVFASKEDAERSD